MESDKREFTAAEIKALYNSNSLLAAIDRSEAELESTIVSLCIELHNSSEIDLLAIAEWPEFKARKGWEFFALQQFFIAVVPSLDAPSDRLMSFVMSLVSKAGSDGAANLPYAALIQWFSAHPAQARDVLVKARSGDKLCVECLSLALQGTGDLREAQVVVAAYDDDRRLAALVAIARLTHATDAERQRTIETVSAIVDEDCVDQCRAMALQAIVSSHSSSGLKLTTEALAIVRTILAKSGEFTLYRSATILLTDRAALNLALVDMLLTALRSIDPSQKGTIGTLDIGLRHLLANGFSIQAIDFVTAVVSRREGGLDLHQFDSFSNALLDAPPATLHSTIMRWLLSGEPALCHGLEKLLRRRRRENKPLDIEVDELGLSDGELWFVCRKAVGYFFTQSVVAASILVSTLRTARSNLMEDVQQLLFDPLLVNFGGDIRKYLEGLPTSDTAFAAVDDTLKRADKYVEGIRSAGSIKEFLPSEHHREIERNKSQDQMREAMKGAENDSVLLGLVKRSILLYGRRSLSFIPDPKGELRPVEMELHSHSVGFEFPRGEIIDSVGLDQTLCRFRLERIVK